MTKQQLIKEYNNKNRGYAITAIKTVNIDFITVNQWCNHSLSDLYTKPSEYKVSSYNDILATYDPIKIIDVRGSCHSYCVVLQAENGGYLHITKSNNYLLQMRGL